MASASPRRRFFLEQSKVQFEVWTPQVEETVKQGELPEDYACRIAELKFQAANRKFPNYPHIIIAADTIVSVGKEIFGKPKNRKQAEVFLRTLSGKWHQVITALCCGRGNHMISATEAERLGLVNKVVPRDELEEATMELAAKLAAKSPLALQIGKTALYAMQDVPYHQSIDYLSELFAALCSTEDAEEGVRAFLEKRKPDWKKR